MDKIEHGGELEDLVNSDPIALVLGAKGIRAVVFYQPVPLRKGLKDLGTREVKG